MSDELDLDALLSVADAATPGPWWQEGSLPNLYVYGMKRGGRPNGEGIIEARYYGRDGNPADAAFIATFDPPTVRQLIERLKTAEADADGRDDWWYEHAEVPLQALRDGIRALADEWEEAEIGVPSPDTALSGNECAADLRSLLADHSGEGNTDE